MQDEHEPPKKSAVFMQTKQSYNTLRGFLLSSNSYKKQGEIDDFLHSYVFVCLSQQNKSIGIHFCLFVVTPLIRTIQFWWSPVIYPTFPPVLWEVVISGIYCTCKHHYYEGDKAYRKQWNKTNANYLSY